MSTRNHDRAPDKKGFSVALPKNLLRAIERIAEAEHRSRNRQIEKFLQAEVDQYLKEHPTKATGKAPTKKPNS